jgi:DNA end-binding protein Ku
MKLSLVSVPVRLYNVINSSSRISMNQLHKGCHQRLRQQLVCAQHGKVEREDIVKGYEYEKDKYVVLEEADIEKVRLETNKVVELVQFVDEQELNPLYFDSPYYVAPDGTMAAEAFRIIREAMHKTNKVAVGRVVLAGREHMVALRVHDRGFTLTTLHYASEVRSAEPYFEEIGNGDVNKDQLALASQLIETNSAPFDATQFKDRYQDSLMDVIKAKIQGSAPVVAQQAEAGKVIDLMSALQQSVAQAKSQKTTKKPPAPSAKVPAAPQKKAKAG